MTRINLVPPNELMDQHLIAEYREITMVPAALKRSLKSKSVNYDVSKIKQRIPSNFTLNQGHVRFFYDKGLYLSKRYDQLIEEMKRRGMNPDSSRQFPVEIFQDELYNDWVPSYNDLEIVRERINLRISEKPSWYRKTGYQK